MSPSHIAGATLIGLILSSAAPAVAGAPLERTQEMLSTVTRLRNDAASTPSEEERKAKIRSAILERFDSEEMSRRALGPEWQKLPAGERREFAGLLGDLFARSYAKLVIEFLTEPNIRYASDHENGKEATVETTFVRHESEEIGVNFHLIRAAKDWRFYDVEIDGVSVVQNYRTEFGKVIRESSYRALREKLEKKRSVKGEE